MKRIGGLWKNEKGFLSGEINKEEKRLRIIIFKNSYKTGRQPDYVIYELEDKKTVPPVEKEKSKPKKKTQADKQAHFPY